jgi:hypothetical protein
MIDASGLCVSEQSRYLGDDKVRPHFDKQNQTSRECGQGMLLEDFSDDSGHQRADGC